jgi:hypothetical protein
MEVHLHKKVKAHNGLQYQSFKFYKYTNVIFHVHNGMLCCQHFLYTSELKRKIVNALKFLVLVTCVSFHEYFVHFKIF